MNVAVLGSCKRISIVALAVACLLLGDSARADDPPARARHLFTEVVKTGLKKVVVRGAFEIIGPPHRWYAVRFQLMQGNGKAMGNIT